MRLFSRFLSAGAPLAILLGLMVLSGGANEAKAANGSPGTATPTPYAPAVPPTPARPAYTPPLLDNGRRPAASPRPSDTAVPMLEQQLQRNQQPARPAPEGVPKASE
ncbi:MAG: hypothetical protein ABWY06_08230 [Pseudomonas sp.]|uniref:hypothetical protein n=1 Tax=Pseudomonas sp. TaxID=306 RepID=UPI00339997AD